MGITRKSIDFYTFIGGSDLSTRFEKPTKRSSDKKTYSFGWDAKLPMQSGETAIANDDIKHLESSGRFRWQADQKRGGKSVKLGAEFWEINPVTGSMKTKYKDSPTDMMQTVSKFSAAENWAYSYGFYDSGAGFGDLTNHDQSYVYVTPDVSNWMGELTRRKPAIAAAPFASFVLPGSHDAGTYYLGNAKTLSKDKSFLTALKDFFLRSIAKDTVMQAIQNFAVTQKDDVAMQLNMGTRYFDFRPGYCMEPFHLIVKGIYHQHALIPGIAYDTFLKDLFRWLVAHPSEIAVLCIDDSGFVTKNQMRPPASVLTTTLESAQKAAGAGAIKIGKAADFAKSYSALVKDNRRLILINRQTSDNANFARKYDSYDDDAYATTKPDSIIRRLNGMTQDGQKGYDYTVLQLQGTASATGFAAQAGTVLNLSDSGSVLMSTKPDFDEHTYPWVVANARKKLGAAQPIVLLNDFVDNALAMHAMTVMEG